MKKIIIALAALVTSGSFYALNPVEQALVNKLDSVINVEKIGSKLREYADQINLNQSAEQVANEIKDLVNKEINDLPSTLLGVNIAELRNNYWNQQTLNILESQGKQVLNILKAEAPQAKDLLKKANAILSHFELVTELLQSVVYPKIQSSLKGDLKNTVNQIINFLENNKDQAAIVAQKLSGVLSFISGQYDIIENFINQKEAQLKTLDLSGASLKDTLSQLAQMINIDAIEAKAQDLYPAVESFVQAHSDEIKNIIAQLKKISLSDIERYLSEAQRQLQSGF